MSLISINAVFNGKSKKKPAVEKLARRAGVMRFDSSVLYYVKKVAVEFLYDVLFRACQYNEYKKGNVRSKMDESEKQSGSLLELLSVILALRSSKYKIDMVAGSQSKKFKGEMIKMSGGGMNGGSGGGTHEKIMTEIVNLQSDTDLLLSKRAFQTLIREIIRDKLKKHLSMTKETIMALQSALEGYLCKLFKEAQLLSIHAKRKQLFDSDIAVARLIRGEIYRIDLD